MTDDLLKRLVDWDEYDEGKLNDMREEAKDRIEKLTERNQELALDYLAALGQSADRIEALTAERDRLHVALTRLLEPFGDDPCYYDHHGYCQAHFIEADCCVAYGRATLKGETP